MHQKKRSLWCCPACGTTNGQYQSICEECNWLPANLRRLQVSWRFLPTAVRVSIARKRALRDGNAVGRLFLAAESTIKPQPDSPPGKTRSLESKYAEVRFHKFESWERVSKPSIEGNDSPKLETRTVNRTPAATLDALKKLNEAPFEANRERMELDGKQSKQHDKRDTEQQLPRPSTKDALTKASVSLELQNTKLSTPRKTPEKVYELNHETFEWYCAEWCVYLGQTDVEVTRATKDGGLDIQGGGFVAQVKFQDVPVGVRAVRELSGVAFSRKGKLAFFFCINGYSTAAIAEAEELDVALFVVKPSSSKIEAVSSLARLVLEDAELR